MGVSRLMIWGREMMTRNMPCSMRLLVIMVN